MSTSEKKKQVVKVVITPRPDLNKFKPSHGDIFDMSDESDKQQKPHEYNKKQKASQTKSKTAPRTSKASSSKPKKRVKNLSRAANDESPDPDEDSDIGDIALSDYSEPETKLRDPELRAESHRKFAKLRKARKQSQFKRLLNKEVHSRRIIPDSDDDNIESKAGQPSGPADDEDDDTSTCSSSSGSDDDSSETDEEERKRREEQFIVDDMATAAQKSRAMKELESHMPAKFRNMKQDNLTHFKTFCEYLVHHALLPQIEWRKCKEVFDNSCQHLEKIFNGRALPMLETSAWIQVFRRELIARPFIRLQANPQGKQGCEACNNRTKISRKIIQLTGQPYSPYTLKPRVTKKRSLSSSSGSSDDSDSSSEPEEDQGKQHKFKLYNPARADPTKPEFHCGEDCANRAVEYHYFKHWQMDVLQQMKEKIKAIKEDKTILKKRFKHTDAIPIDKRLKVYKREIREIFHIIQQDKSFDSLENMFRRLMSRLNRVHKTYGA